MRKDLPGWVYERFDASGPDVRDYSGRAPYAWDRLGARLSHRALDYPWSALMRQMLCDVAAQVGQDMHRSPPRGRFALLTRC